MMMMMMMNKTPISMNDDGDLLFVSAKNIPIKVAMQRRNKQNIVFIQIIIIQGTGHSQISRLTRWWPVQVQQSHHIEGDNVQLLANDRRQTRNCSSKLAVHQLLDVRPRLGDDVH